MALSTAATIRLACMMKKTLSVGKRATAQNRDRLVRILVIGWCRVDNNVAIYEGLSFPRDCASDTWLVPHDAPAKRLGRNSRAGSTVQAGAPGFYESVEDCAEERVDITAKLEYYRLPVSRDRFEAFQEKLLAIEDAQCVSADAPCSAQ